MRVRRLVPLLALAALGAALAAHFERSSRAAVSSTLHANVGPDFDISLTFDDGTAVGAPPAGTYRLLAVDQSPDHNFHLFGPGVNVDTGVEPVGTTSWTVTLQSNSRYVFQCDVHPDSMSGVFTIGTPAAGATGSTPSGGQSIGNTGTADPLVGTLTAAVSAGKARLLRGGRPVARLAVGTYRIVVSDTSAKDGLSLRHLGFGAATRLTGVPFVGRRTATVDLKAGRWEVFSTRHEATSGVVFRVAAK